ncbi:MULTISPECIES: FAD-dependent oxidoreductase [Mesoflavibacter]|uniref:FAD-dependent oxidoreductase n=1 Tax=Mesoflavibacter profundi TaxID=2708110 RepID=A0ABT4S2F8_9FLAO|nr:MULTISPECIES: FAD-dependent oxidoreductase [Mesoflavibacter]MDA0178201.1 FAD-dependent oxidoreductase [Mesoflavibacter profundi]QIJ89163.1 fumarate reductase/succinate dehydrogenase flavoprotein domain-containing protein [Mesoflavibacter sp. HG96]QIJ91891.1 fumarate reductase/succinate dehydrogenase flavoprotein domain-containing protein [Mesoflavibacter sp. HG37]
MNFDTLIIGGGAAGLSCALVLGSGLQKPFASNKTVGIITHQKSSHLQNALFNNVLGLTPGTLGKDLLESGKLQLSNLYPEVIQIEKEKVKELVETNTGFTVITNKNSYNATRVVIAVGYTNLLTIKGLETYIKPHPRAAIEKDRIWLENKDHLIKENLYVAGTLAGWRSQFAIASGSGAHVATDILTIWNDGKHTKVHDKI